MRDCAMRGTRARHGKNGDNLRRLRNGHRWLSGSRSGPGTRRRAWHGARRPDRPWPPRRRWFGWQGLGSRPQFGNLAGFNPRVDVSAADERGEFQIAARGHATQLIERNRPDLPFSDSAKPRDVHVPSLESPDQHPVPARRRGPSSPHRQPISRQRKHRSDKLSYPEAPRCVDFTAGQFSARRRLSAGN